VESAFSRALELFIEVRLIWDLKASLNKFQEMKVTKIELNWKSTNNKICIKAPQMSNPKYKHLINLGQRKHC
jgi:hypothetical protein